VLFVRDALFVQGAHKPAKRVQAIARQETAEIAEPTTLMAVSES
jgi:hypothetical protein